MKKLLLLVLLLGSLSFTTYSCADPNETFHTYRGIDLKIKNLKDNSELITGDTVLVKSSIPGKFFKKLGIVVDCLPTSSAYAYKVNILPSNLQRNIAKNEFKANTYYKAKPIKLNNEMKTKDESTLAYVMIKRVVKSYLKSPRTAKFPGAFDGRAGHTRSLGGGSYQITSWVDSQNSFGAMIRTSFTATIYLYGDNYKVKQLTIGSQVIR